MGKNPKNIKFERLDGERKKILFPITVSDGKKINLFPSLHTCSGFFFLSIHNHPHSKMGETFFLNRKMDMEVYASPFKLMNESKVDRITYLICGRSFTFFMTN